MSTIIVGIIETPASSMAAKRMRDDETVRPDRNLAPDLSPIRPRPTQPLYFHFPPLLVVEKSAFRRDMGEDVDAVMKFVALCAVDERGGPGEEGVDVGRSGGRG